jgi:hypothetical protein
VTAGMCRLTTLCTGRLYILEILIWLYGYNATVRIMLMSPSGIEITTFKIVAHRHKVKVRTSFEVPRSLRLMTVSV